MTPGFLLGLFFVVVFAAVVGLPDELLQILGYLFWCLIVVGLAFSLVGHFL